MCSGLPEVWITPPNEATTRAQIAKLPELGTVLGQKDSSDAPFYTKSSRLRHPPPGHNLYENPQKFGCAPENP